MDALKYFILGFIFVYVIQILDLLIQLLSGYISILITKCNVIINELSEGQVEQPDPYCIGFQVNSHEEEYEIDGDYVDKKKN